MKINSWLNWGEDCITELKRIQKVFPRIDTLRIDLETLQKMQTNDIVCKSKIIEVVDGNFMLMSQELNEDIKQKFTYSSYPNILGHTKTLLIGLQELQKFNDRRDNSIKKLYIIAYFMIDQTFINILNQMKGFHICIEFRGDRQTDLINLRNELTSTIVLVYKSVNCRCVVPCINDIAFCMDPFRNEQSKLLYEQYYLPYLISMTIDLLIGNNDLRMFKFLHVFECKINNFEHLDQLLLPSSLKLIHLKSINEILNENLEKFTNTINRSYNRFKNEEFGSIISVHVQDDNSIAIEFEEPICFKEMCQSFEMPNFCSYFVIYFIFYITKNDTNST
ncbi:hypothetical protein QTN25_002825 [Entamoeba marina]